MQKPKPKSFSLINDYRIFVIPKEIRVEDHLAFMRVDYLIKYNRSKLFNILGAVHF